jgi:Ca-activated chloride channel family protein
MEVEIDEVILKKISSMTNGAYFRATNNQKLKEIYAEIDKLEKSKVDVKQYTSKYEEYRFFAFAAFLLLVLEMLLRVTLLRSIT